jgi:hypothetical protein
MKNSYSLPIGPEEIGIGGEGIVNVSVSMKKE